MHSTSWVLLKKLSVAQNVSVSQSVTIRTQHWLLVSVCILTDIWC